MRDSWMDVADWLHLAATMLLAVVVWLVHLRARRAIRRAQFSANCAEAAVAIVSARVSLAVGRIRELEQLVALRRQPAAEAARPEPMKTTACPGCGAAYGSPCRAYCPLLRVMGRGG